MIPVIPIEPLRQWIDLVNRWLQIPVDSTQIRQWVESAEKLADSYNLYELIGEEYISHIISCYEKVFVRKAELIQQNYTKNETLEDIRIQDLCTRKQIEQRTPEWYEQMGYILSASELGNLFGSARARAQLVMTKTVPPEPRNNLLAVQSDRMTAFDWGIRFEPVVKQIYCHMYGADIKELGRIISRADNRCSASPDGLIISDKTGKKRGHLIEIKCPVTREPNGEVPKDYYLQMQMQLHVTECDVCEYVEAQFSSRYSKPDTNREGPVKYYGTIYLIQQTNEDHTASVRYEYGPVNDDTWQLQLTEFEEILETIPWRLYSWSEQSVYKDPNWWPSIKPAIDSFWEDVEKAKRGEFTVPEPTRKRAKPSVQAQFVFEEDTTEQQPTITCLINS